VRRLLTLAAGVLLLAPTHLLAQSSQFGIRALGYPNQPYSARARAMGGANALFDPESALNPASLAYLNEMTAAFTVMSDRRVVTTPAGEGNVKSMRFPLFSINGPLKSQPFTFGVSASTYFARDFSVAYQDTVDIRGTPTPTVDTLTAQGGLTDIRGTVVWRVNPRFALGLGIHGYTGVNRIDRARHFQDTGYVAIHESSEVSAAGSGFDIGIIKTLGKALTIGAVLRSDGEVRVRRDSLSQTTYPVDLPYSAAFGAQFRASRHLRLASQVVWRGWGSTNDELIAVGGTGSRDTWEAGLGAEFIPSLDHPNKLPLRIGVRRASMPFPLQTGEMPTETNLSFGTGFLFGKERGGADVTVERVWRAEANNFEERAWLLTVTATLRPNGRSR
jgi:long-subunit fatty acid transport protein